MLKQHSTTPQIKDIQILANENHFISEVHSIHSHVLVILI
ncbi:hypothetical protein NMY3_03199 [Candidatus Nitrosocosmicus oleophilus]|uniref:Uncharacterized protein n=1 Tax=Candidatus Nitrosocosmicus oleophilus TaxID=1353260 RepID=A0A654M0N0_9ARCH|nr:hypothetical protein NMY3_03199 [Candidatus Nitrosocosmicus oleophilus]